jgi:uncharacterized membrane protein
MSAIAAETSLDTVPRSDQPGLPLHDTRARPQWLLRLSAATWFSVAAVGQLLFAYYILRFYGGNALRGNPGAWTTVLEVGYAAGATTRNTILISHLAAALLINVMGVLQLVPAVRSRWPRFHRVNGRVYLVTVVVAAMGGATLLLTGTSEGRQIQYLASGIMAMLIIMFAALALRAARARRIDSHRRWALRLFLTVNGGWFFRISLMLWIVANRGPVGFDGKTFTGPFLDGLAFAQYLVPLGIAELYFRAKASTRPALPYTVAAGLFVLALGTLAGVAAATAIMWAPHW